MELGGVEYLINDRDGLQYFYDINALSNFVADAPSVVGFDPFIDLVDFIIKRARVRANSFTRVIEQPPVKRAQERYPEWHQISRGR